MKKGASEQPRENERADARARARASERAGKRARVKERERTLERENERKSESKEKLHTHIWHTLIHVWQTHKYTKHADIKTQTQTQASYCCCAIHHSVYVCTDTHVHTHTHTYTHTCCCRDMESGLGVATMGSHTQLCVTPQNTLFNNNEQLTHPDTRWSRPIGCLQSQVSFRRRAINSRALFQEMTYKYKAYYGSSQPYSVTNAHLL